MSHGTCEAQAATLRLLDLAGKVAVADAQTAEPYFDQTYPRSFGNPGLNFQNESRNRQNLRQPEFKVYQLRKENSVATSKLGDE